MLGLKDQELGLRVWEPDDGMVSQGLRLWSFSGAASLIGTSKHTCAYFTVTLSYQCQSMFMFFDGLLQIPCLPLPVFVVESTEVLKLGDFFEVFRQFIQLPVLFPVKVGFHERANLNTNTCNRNFRKACVSLAEEKVMENMRLLLITYLQSILWIHEEVSPNVIKHYGVLPVVKFSILPPYHTKRFYLDMCTSQCQHVNIDQLKGSRSMFYHAWCSRSLPHHFV